MGAHTRCFASHGFIADAFKKNNMIGVTCQYNADMVISHPWLLSAAYLHILDSINMTVSHSHLYDG